MKSLVSTLTVGLAVLFALAGIAPAHAATPTSDWTVVVGGDQHTCGVRSGMLYCWGDNLQGQMGAGALAYTVYSSPLRVTAVSDWKAAAAGGHHTCGIRGTGALYCWGDNDSGQVGDGGGVGNQISPKRITNVVDWKRIDAGGTHTCGIRGAGALYCWGYNGYGQIGDGTSTVDRNSPTRITSVSDWKVVSAGGNHTCAIRGTGALYCWGYNGNGQVGDGTFDTYRPSPKRITSVSDWKAVSAGGNHTCAIRGTGALYCWGYGGRGQVGAGARADKYSPTRITAVSDWKVVSAGGDHTCAIRGAGALYCWGYNGYGQIGDGTSGTDRLTPKRITAVSDWKLVSGGLNHTCGIRGIGALYCWGNRTDGQIGDGQTGFKVFAPERI